MDFADGTDGKERKQTSNVKLQVPIRKLGPVTLGVFTCNPLPSPSGNGGMVRRLTAIR